MSSKEISNIREDFSKSKIDYSSVPESPFTLFENWFDMALLDDKENAICFVLSTITKINKPSSRVVLLRGFNEKGFTFYTNYKSDKAKDIDHNNYVSANFFWNNLEKQVRITGLANKISSEESDQYFKGRPRGSQLGAWVSDQSSVVNFNDDFSLRSMEVESQFNGVEVSRPENWGGYCIIPEKIEFWQGRPSRLHDRLVYKKKGDIWIKERLSP
tara:strand:- start:60 stop:704 length:645 start_codon:yes stop_codon:yes gene_type:complete